jgi:DNA helicase-2/ATP-dependent DNA helicase PcrA
MDRFQALLLSLNRAESILFPHSDDDLYTALPRGIATPEDVALLGKFTAFVRRLFALRPLPVDALALALGDELFAHNKGDQHEGDLAIAYQIANVLRGWQDIEPERRLPDLVAQLGNVAEGRQHLNAGGRGDEGYVPKPGRITLTTQHSGKGLEWDAVFMVGVDSSWIPSSLDDYFQGVYDFVGGDPSAQASAELFYIMEGSGRMYAERTPTETAHLDIMCERLRLLYVGITRARRFLQISRSKIKRIYGKDNPTQAALPVAELYHFLQSYKQSSAANKQ